MLELSISLVWDERSHFKDQRDQKISNMDQGRSKDQRSSCFTDQRIKVHQRSKINKIKDQENQPEINFFQITDQKFKVQLFTDQITKLDLVRRKPSLSRNEENSKPMVGVRNKPFSFPPRTLPQNLTRYV